MARRTDEADADRLVREEAGRYRSRDGRFEVRQGDTGWYLVDSAHADELGQPLLHGPFPTLTAARDALAGARKTQPLKRGRSKA